MDQIATSAELPHRSANTNLAYPLVLLLIAISVFLYGLGGRPLEDWDEAIYAQIAKEMVQSGDWLTLHWEFQNWFEKPPLLMWTTAVFYRLFGVKEFWSRAASAFSGIGVVALVYLLGKHLYSARVGFLAGLISLTTFLLVAFARVGMTDVMLTFFTYLAIYAFVRQQQQQQRREGKQTWWYVVCAACALAMLAKGAGGWVAPATIFVALLFDKRRFDTLRTPHFWFGLLLGLAIVLPWHLLMYFKHGQTFADEYLGYHVLSRIATPLEGHPSSYIFYVLVLIDGFLPWSFLIPFAIVSSVRENLRGEPRSRLPLLLAALVFGGYMLVQTKIVSYILPVYPALALLVAAFVRQLYLSLRHRRRLKFALTAACVFFLLMGGVYCFVRILRTYQPEPPLLRIAKLAASRSASDREPLLLFSDTEALTRPAVLFYGNRPLRQVYLTNEPRGLSARRYENPEIISSVVGATPVRIILNRAEAEKLSADYEMKIEATADPYIYAFIKRKNAPPTN
jgi:4-amino-4-deoxy-L-arabinose transferase-like glycosyltransferase